MTNSIGKYEIIRPLATGGMGEIYLARFSGESGFEKKVVIKSLLPQFTSNTEILDMFKDEAKLCGQLEHDNIVRVIEFEQLDGLFYLVMEFVDGSDLLQLMQFLKEKNEIIPIEYAIYIIIECCHGLHYAHTFQNLQIVHRDISPQNIFLSKTGGVKIGDFGIAKARERLTHTETGALKGKINYMSPEQAFGLEIDLRSDIFSLGAVLFEICTGSQMFSGKTSVQITEIFKNFDISLEERFIHRVPSFLQPTLTHALAKNKDERFQTSLEFKKSLQASVKTAALSLDKDDFSTWLKKTLVEFPEQERKKIDYQPQGTKKLSHHEEHLPHSIQKKNTAEHIRMEYLSSGNENQKHYQDESIKTVEPEIVGSQYHHNKQKRTSVSSRFENTKPEDLVLEFEKKELPKKKSSSFSLIIVLLVFVISLGFILRMVKPHIFEATINWIVTGTFQYDDTSKDILPPPENNPAIQKNEKQ